jgi:hypothetical protein
MKVLLAGFMMMAIIMGSTWAVLRDIDNKQRIQRCRTEHLECLISATDQKECHVRAKACFKETAFW